MVLSQPTNDSDMDAEQRACLVLERLIDRLRDAKVEYQCGAGVHEFTICYAESRCSVRFPEAALLRRGTEALEQAVAQIVDRIRANIMSASAEQRPPLRMSMVA
jgi:hypothetical protein